MYVVQMYEVLYQARVPVPFKRGGSGGRPREIFKKVKQNPAFERKKKKKGGTGHPGTHTGHIKRWLLQYP